MVPSHVLKAIFFYSYSLGYITFYKVKGLISIGEQDLYFEFHGAFFMRLFFINSNLVIKGRCEVAMQHICIEF
jgi:hypothetical protein